MNMHCHFSGHIRLLNIYILRPIMKKHTKRLKMYVSVLNGSWTIYKNKNLYSIEHLILIIFYYQLLYSSFTFFIFLYCTCIYFEFWSSFYFWSTLIIDSQGIQWPTSRGIEEIWNCIKHKWHKVHNDMKLFQDFVSYALYFSIWWTLLYLHWLHWYMWMKGQESTLRRTSTES